MKYTPSLITAIAAVLLFGCGPEAPKTPEEQAFIDANNKILTYKDQFAFGNNPDAQARANKFSITMNEMQKLLFTGGGKIHGMTAGNFLTYCQLTPEEVIFMCTVPGMKDYREEAREALAELAWTTGQQVGSNLPPETKLVVALKGSLLYGPVWSGKVSGPPALKNKGREAMKPYYPAFQK